MKAAVVALVGLGACASVELAPPLVRARTGPAMARPIRRVVAIPATCGALSVERIDAAGKARATCPDTALRAVDMAIRSQLEFGGFEIIDSEQVNAVTATRHEVQERWGHGPTTTTTEQHGARFEDATPFEQTAILQELGAEGVLNTRLWIGAGVGFGQRRTIAVQIRLLATSDGALAWARRCELEVGGITTDEVAMERGTRCAIADARAR